MMHLRGKQSSGYDNAFKGEAKQAGTMMHLRGKQSSGYDDAFKGEAKQRAR